MANRTLPGTGFLALLALAPLAAAQGDEGPPEGWREEGVSEVPS